MQARISGVFAAPVTPLDPSGGVDLDAFDRLLDFLFDRGVEGICVGGATSEYPQFDLDERKALISRAARKTYGRGSLLVSVGACSIMRVLNLSRHAIKEGARALLLPAPHFFPCEQADLEAFCIEVSRSLPAPYLLYNLPEFTTGFDLTTSIRLLQGGAGFVGVKDSSGDPRAVEALPEARGRHQFSLLVGNDTLLLRSLTAGWDGVISGTAGVCPELYAGLFRSFRAGDFNAAQRCQALIEEVSRKLMSIPFPLGIRIGVHARGFSTGPLPLPVSGARRDQIKSLHDWLPRWLEEHLPAVAGKPR